MAATDFVPTLWAGVFLHEYWPMQVFGALCTREYEGEIRAAGDTVKIPSMSNVVAVYDYTGADITAPQTPTGGTESLTIDKKKYYNVLVDDVLATQSKPNNLMELSNRAAISMARQVDRDAAADFYLAQAAARTIQIDDNWTSTTIAKEFVMAVSDLKGKMDTANIPPRGRWIVFHPDTVSLLERYLLGGAGAGVFLPASAESAFRNGFLGRLLGFDIHVATEGIKQRIISTKNYWELVAGEGTREVALAEQLLMPEMYRPEKRFGQGVKALNLYGSALTRGSTNAKLYFLRHKQRGVD